MIRFFCSTCGTKVQTPDENAGKSGACPKCRGQFVVPPASAAELAESISNIANDIPIPAGQRPPTPMQQSPTMGPPPTRPASPFEVYGTEASPAEFSTEPAPTDESTIPTDEQEPEYSDQFSTPLPPRIPRPPAPPNWLPLILGGVGALLIVVTIIIGVMGRRTPPIAQKNQTTLPADPPKPAPKPRPQIEYTSRTPPSNPTPTVQPTIIPATTQPTANSPARPPVVIARTSGQPQLVFDPAPQRPNPTTKPILAAKQIKTSQSLITPVQINNTAYFAAKDGNFYGINTDSLEVVEQLKLAQPVNRLIRDGSRLKAESLPPNAQTVLDFGSSIDALDPENADPSGTAASIAGKPLPQKFSQHLFAEKQVVSLNGKLYRPLTLGGIRILDGNNVSEHTTKVVGMGLWKIALLPQGPMGYDNTSVYALDDNLRPTKRLINLDPDVGRWTSARVNSFLASDGKSLCFLSAYNNKARMMIWSPHGSKKLREVPVTYNETITTEGNRLILLGDGYLFCGGELTWLPSGDAAPLRFAIGAPIPSAAAPARRSAAIITPTAPRKVQNFTPPIVSGDKILVGHAAGNVYVFDTSTFAAPSSGQDGTGRAQSNP